MRYEYKVIAAPSKGIKVKGVKAASARFALGLEQEINALAAEGWEYLRADILPSEERHGLTSTTTVYRSVLVFRRACAEPAGESRDDLALQAEPRETPDAPGSPSAPAFRRGPPLTARRHDGPAAADAPPAPAPHPEPVLTVISTDADADTAPEPPAPDGAAQAEAPRSGDEETDRR